MRTDEEKKLSQIVVQALLRTGLALAILLMLIGLIVKVSQGDLSSPAVTLHELFNSQISIGDRLMAWGVLALALTPVMRVLMLLVLWAREKDWVFVGVCIGVFIVLMAAIASGGG